MLAQGHTTISKIDQEIQERFSIAQNLENTISKIKESDKKILDNSKELHELRKRCKQLETRNKILENINNESENDTLNDQTIPLKQKLGELEIQIEEEVKTIFKEDQEEFKESTWQEHLSLHFHRIIRKIKCIKNNTKLLSHAELVDHLEESKKIKYDEKESSLSLNFEFDECKQFANTIDFSVLPDLSSLTLLNVDLNTNDDTNKLLEFCMPLSVQLLWFNSYSRRAVVFSEIKFLNLQSVTKELHISLCKLTGKDFFSLLESCCHLHTLGVTSCNVDTSKPMNINMKFSCLNTLDLTTVIPIIFQQTQIGKSTVFNLKFTSIFLEQCSTGYESKWTKFPKRLTNIFKSIAACNPLKNSIKVVNLAFSGVDKEVKEQMMIELGLASIDLRNTN